MCRTGSRLTIVYLLFLLVLWSFVRFVVPTVGTELNRMVEQLRRRRSNGSSRSRMACVERYPTLREPLDGFLRSALSDERAAIIDEQLAVERARLDLSEAAVADAEEAAHTPDRHARPSTSIGRTACT